MATKGSIKPARRLYPNPTPAWATNDTSKVSMKITLKQRIRNWLMADSANDELAYTQDITIEEDKLHSEGMRLQIYKASGGFVVETRKYDMTKDRNVNTMHVITDEQDLGDALGKIVMMEALRG